MTPENDQIANRDLKMKFVSIRKKRKRYKHTHRLKDRVSVIHQ